MDSGRSRKIAEIDTAALGETGLCREVEWLFDERERQARHGDWLSHPGNHITHYQIRQKVAEGGISQLQGTRDALRPRARHRDDSPGTGRAKPVSDIRHRRVRSN